MRGYCQLDQCHYQKSQKTDRIVICGFHTPGNLKKIIFFKNIKF